MKYQNFRLLLSVEKEQRIIIPEIVHPLKYRIEQFCVYQERCQQEVRQKLFEWGAHSNEVEQLIADLISSNYLNEERFAIAFVGGKFRIKKWGRKKIIYALKQKQVSSYCITRGLKEIDEEVYMDTLEKVLLSKSKNYTSGTAIQKKKIALFAQQRGFESELIWKLINKK